MCENCGCSDHGTIPEEGSGHSHAQDHEHGRVVDIRKPVLERNDRLAERNRGFFLGRGITAVNLLSAPGSGKTALIEGTVSRFGKKIPLGVVVGDLQTENDAIRIRRAGAPAVQITTGEACHLDAHMVNHALEKLNLTGLRLLFIENVGNLVCPAMFDLGEKARVVLMSVTEGEDKPLKYPVMFHRADVVVISKIDLAEAAGFVRVSALENLRRVAPRARVIELSAKTGQGMDAWGAWLESLLAPG